MAAFIKISNCLSVHRALGWSDLIWNFFTSPRVFSKRVTLCPNLWTMTWPLIRIYNLPFDYLVRRNGRRDTNKLVSCLGTKPSKVLSNGRWIVVRVELIPLSVRVLFIGVSCLFSSGDCYLSLAWWESQLQFTLTKQTLRLTKVRYGCGGIWDVYLQGKFIAKERKRDLTKCAY